MKKVLVVGGFDDLGARDVRLLHESSRLGEVTVRAHTPLFAALRVGIKDTWPNVFSRIDELLGFPVHLLVLCGIVCCPWASLVG
jgi:hypothetical protein